MDRYRLRDNFDEIVQRVEKARMERSEHHIVQIVAVTKYVGTEEIEALYELGQRAFGESRVQDLKTKSEALSDLPIEWHFIGRLQKNKINHLIDLNPWLMQSLDSLELALEIDKRLEKKGKTMDCLLQINSAKEESKAGVLPEVAYDEYLKIIEETKHLNLCGVMTIGAHTDDTTLIQKSFETTYKIFESLKPHGAQICSMGMSNDFELAIRCGSNMVRIGSLFFK
ncbi:MULTISPECIES: YggS family pyridoxal phosphate-dependent enzyme [unclassified Nitratiruptor]|uniref:YggS family pyridoxal phosphate-dependent enzyme n=1 Tax=unclassified Nitratiruptor TaxID=2624044 RepID=UPI001916056C|nr:MULTISPECIES: YggS family pyridoxal phosphate-dependent enzyme [unclassified Nitratiruptor]BCD59998.1 PLP dependent protein [Nitratiruptor sp. YY08-10]BCD63921.1 PLP dependent protein [Nitratiruptor sp. YY08-14]